MLSGYWPFKLKKHGGNIMGYQTVYGGESYTFIATEEQINQVRPLIESIGGHLDDDLPGTYVISFSGTLSKGIFDIIEVLQEVVNIIPDLTMDIEYRGEDHEDCGWINVANGKVESERLDEKQEDDKDYYIDGKSAILHIMQGYEEAHTHHIWWMLDGEKVVVVDSVPRNWPDVSVNIKKFDKDEINKLANQMVKKEGWTVAMYKKEYLTFDDDDLDDHCTVK